jgi:DUF971 family protein
MLAAATRTGGSCRFLAGRHSPGGLGENGPSLGDARPVDGLRPVVEPPRIVTAGLRPIVEQRQLGGVGVHVPIMKQGYDRNVRQAVAVDERYEPAAIDVAKEEGVTITFHDGFVARFDLESLRLACPCAGCRGMRDRGEAPWPRSGSPAPLRIDDAALHGAWGLDIWWNDGHSTGIYPFELLREWAEGRA